MTTAALPSCVVCGDPGVGVEPPRRTLARGVDEEDSSYSVIAVLPDVVLCTRHQEELAHRELHLGWCDDEHCRAFGQSGAASSCGKPYKELKA